MLMQQFELFWLGEIPVHRWLWIVRMRHALHNRVSFVAIIAIVRGQWRAHDGQAVARLVTSTNRCFQTSVAIYMGQRWHWTLFSTCPHRSLCFDFKGVPCQQEVPIVERLIDVRQRQTVPRQQKNRIGITKQ
jgi:hypothetical protein